MNFSGSQTLGGTGTVVFAGPGPYNALAISSGTLTIGSGITVDGQSGYVGYSPEIGGSPSVVNQGTIQANVSGGTITVYGTGSQSSGSLEALDGATLSLQGGNWEDSGVNYADSTSVFSLDGSFSNSGNTISLTGPGTFNTSGTIQGGTISVAAGTILNPGGVLDGVTIDGNMQEVGENSVVLQNGLTLNGTATLGGNGGGNWGSLNFSGSQTLGGTGTVVFAGPGPYNALAISSGTLTIGSGITVDGQSGYVGYSPEIGGSPSVLNQGTIQADVSGGTITINGAGSQNTGSLEATNGATLYLEGTLTNSATISIDATSELLLSGTLSDGTISSQTGAQIYGGVLDGVTIDGNFQEVGENSVVVTDGLTLNGTATLGGNGGGNWGSLNFSGSQTLGGTGTVVFTGPGPYNALGVSNGTLTIGSGITVEGQSGYVGYNPEIGGSPSVVNQGTIEANTTGSTITINGAGSQNTGSLEATNGATLYLEGTLTNSATISIDATSELLLSGTLSDGTISSQTGAQIYGGVLDGVTIDGNFQEVGENSVVVQNGLTLNGTATLGGNGGGNWGSLNFSGSQTLGGTGTVVFAGPGPYNALAISSGTLTIGSGITVQGQSGYVGYNPEIGGSPSVVNQGTIEADVSGGTITVEGNIQNTGTLDASGGGTLSLEGYNFTPGGVIEADTGSTVSIGGTVANTGTILSPTGDGTVAIAGTVDGGTIDVGTGTDVDLAGSTLDGVTLSGDYQLAENGFVYIESDLTLDGTLTLGSGDNTYGALYFESGGSQTLGGSGVVTFSGGSSYDSLGMSSGTLTIGSGVTVDGQSGYVGFSPLIGGSVTVVNQGTIEADVSGGTITVEGNIQNTGTLDASGGGTLSLEGYNFTPGGVIEADTGSTVSIGGTVANTGTILSPTGDGTVAITGTVDGGTIDVGTGTDVDLAGSTLDGVTLSGDYQLAENGFVYIESDLTLDGTLTLGSGDNTYGALYFESGGSQTLGGSGVVAFSGGSSYDSLAMSSGTLTIGSGVTVDGQSGDVGFSPLIGGSVTVVNLGTIQADVSGGTITVEGNIQNTGTLDASGGGTLSLEGYNFTPGGVIEADTGSTVSIGGTVANTGTIFIADRRWDGRDRRDC